MNPEISIKDKNLSEVIEEAKVEQSSVKKEDTPKEQPSSACDIKENNIESGKIFHDNLKRIKKIQENIINSTLITKEKIISANEISLDQIKGFKENSLKYGKYLKLIQSEMFMIQDLMK